MPEPAGAMPGWWPAARDALHAADPVLALIVRAHGAAHLSSRGDAFTTLARSIVGQQISLAAAQSIWLRTLAAAGAMTPAALAAASPDALRAAGLSARKAEYLAELARGFDSGRLDAARWAALDDEAVIAELVRIRGVGRWTAEMFLMFNLLRPDVLPVDDVGLLRAVGLHYLGGERPTRAQTVALGERWRPWRTAATWHLWRSLDPIPVEY